MYYFQCLDLEYLNGLALKRGLYCKFKTGYVLDGDRDFSQHYIPIHCQQIFRIPSLWSGTVLDAGGE